MNFVITSLQLDCPVTAETADEAISFAYDECLKQDKDYTRVCIYQHGQLLLELRRAYDAGTEQPNRIVQFSGDLPSAEGAAMAQRLLRRLDE